jgi:hypothetical protein
VRGGEGAEHRVHRRAGIEGYGAASRSSGGGGQRRDKERREEKTKKVTKKKQRRGEENIRTGGKNKMKITGRAAENERGRKKN